MLFNLEIKENLESGNKNHLLFNYFCLINQGKERRIIL
ncbi:hypothetical protein SC09_contig8orf00203 [Bacillus subtilis]|uniref:Uncharacterized protein n=1 Tax=Bacillus subtilis TaxID=1423 RepID=A0A0D1KEA7_BACIU|nr:hypothetical protein SC09_contig8orf00203 [Bacillus subtilis]